MSVSLMLIAPGRDVARAKIPLYDAVVGSVSALCAPLLGLLLAC